MQINSSLALAGLSILSTALQPGPHKTAAIADILVGRHDDALKAAFQLSAPALSEDLLNYKLDFLKDRIRTEIQILFDHLDRVEELQAEARKKEVIAEVQEHNKPHELGTVAEIAAKFGISKSEVRRRKIDGTLHELELK